MKKLLKLFVFSFLFISIINFTNGLNVSLGSLSLNELVENFTANAETDDEFYDATGCRATTENVSCRSHSYAYDARP